MYTISTTIPRLCQLDIIPCSCYLCISHAYDNHKCHTIQLKLFPCSQSSSLLLAEMTYVYLDEDYRVHTGTARSLLI